MGKSLYIRRRREALAEVTTDHESCLQLIIPLHGPMVTADSVIEALKEYIGYNKAIIFHLDIASNVRVYRHAIYTMYLYKSTVTILYAIIII